MRFNIKNGYAGKFQKEIVRGKQHEELWIPAEELVEFNNNIIGHIDVIAAYFGEGFVGSPPETGFTNKSATADEYLQLLLNTFEYNSMDFRGSVVMNYKSVFCNYAYWKQRDIALLTAKDNNKAKYLLPAIADTWQSNFIGITLPTEAKIQDYEQKQLI